MKLEIIKKFGGMIVITNGVTELAPGNGFKNWREARAALNFLKKFAKIC